MWRRDRNVHFGVGSSFHGGASCKSAHFFVPFLAVVFWLFLMNKEDFLKALKIETCRFNIIARCLAEEETGSGLFVTYICRFSLLWDSSHKMCTLLLWCVECVRVIVRVDPGVKCKHTGGLKAMDYLLYYPRYVVILLSWTPTMIGKWQGL